MLLPICFLPDGFQRTFLLQFCISCFFLTLCHFFGIRNLNFKHTDSSSIVNFFFLSARFFGRNQNFCLRSSLIKLYYEFSSVNFTFLFPYLRKRAVSPSIFLNNYLFQFQFYFFDLRNVRTLLQNFERSRFFSQKNKFHKPS